MRIKTAIWTLIIVAMSSFSFCAEEVNLLIQIYTKNNPDQFFQTLDHYYKNVSKEFKTQFLILCDADDKQMNQPEIQKRFQTYPHLMVKYSELATPAEMHHEAIKPFADWFTVLIVANDHDYPNIVGFDKLIVDEMKAHFPLYDGVINLVYDTTDVQKINRLPIIGRHYHSTVNPVFDLKYKTFTYGCQELTFVSRMMGKEHLSSQKLFQQVPAVDPISQDVVAEDRILYLERAQKTFGIDEKVLRARFPKDWSILICTLPERSTSFEKIYKKLTKQIKEAALEDKVEVLYFLDNRENTVGYKRNELLRRSQGLYANFIDDDDDVHDCYIKMIHEKLASYPDCVSLVGIITFNGKTPKRFIHSIDYHSYFEKDNVYYRPPNHLNTIKRSVGSRFLFPNFSYGEDTDWAMQISRSGLLKTEEKIKTPYYFYLYNDK